MLCSRFVILGNLLLVNCPVTLRPTSLIAVIEGAAVPPNEIILLDISKDGEVKS